MGIRHRLQSGNAVCRTAPAMREYYIRVLYMSKGTTRKYMTSHKNTSLGMSEKINGDYDAEARHRYSITIGIMISALKLSCAS